MKLSRARLRSLIKEAIDDIDFDDDGNEVHAGRPVHPPVDAETGIPPAVDYLIRTLVGKMLQEISKSEGIDLDETDKLHSEAMDAVRQGVINFYDAFYMR